MIYLFFSILGSTTLFILFKLFERYNVNTFQAIVINYITAFIIGVFSYKSAFNINQVIYSKWFIGSAILGLLFIVVFNLMALTAQRQGLSVVSVAGKMSVIIPVVFGIYVYKESVGSLKIIGILLALIAVYLTSIKQKNGINLKKGLWLPFLIFIGSGIIDTLIKYIETTYVPKNGIPIYSASIFGVAGLLGLLHLYYKIIIGEFKLDSKSIIAGIVLGFVNYYSIYFLLKALQYEGLDSSSIFTMNNLGIVMLSTLFGLILFKETISKKNWIGIVLAIISIILVAY